MPAHLKRKPSIGRTVTYFKPTTGKRVPAQIIAVRNHDTVDLRLANGTVLTNVPRSIGRQGFGAWGWVRGRETGATAGDTFGGGAYVGPVLRQAEAVWLACEYKPGLTPQWLKDLSGFGHHMRVGSVGRADIVDGALQLPGVAGNYASAPPETQAQLLANGTFEVNTANWVNNINATLTRTTTAGQFRSGVAALSMAATAIGSASVISSDHAPVVAGQTYFLEAWLKASVATRACQVGITWWTAADVIIGSAVFGASVSVTTAGFVSVSVSAVAPANAAYVRVVVMNTDVTTALGEAIFIDDVRLNLATGVDIVNDFDFSAYVAPDKWNNGTYQTILGKDNTVDRQYQFGLAAGAQIYVYAGAWAGVRQSSLAVPGIADGTGRWIRAARAAGTIRWYHKALESDAWTEHGTPVVEATPISIGIQPLVFGALSAAGTQPFAGRIGRVTLSNSGTTVFDADFGTQRDGTPWFTETLGKRVTVFPARAAVVGGVYYVAGINGQCAQSANHPDFAIIGDVDFRVKMTPDDWTPTTAQRFLTKDNTGTQRSWALTLTSSGVLQLELSADGTAIVPAVSSVATGFADGTTKWIRVTWRQSDGRVQFLSSDDEVTWAPIGANQTAAVASIFVSTTPVEIGSRSGGANPGGFIGKIHRVKILNGIDGPTVFDVDFSNWPDGAGVIEPYKELTGKYVKVVSDVTGADTNDPTFLPYSGEKYLYLPGSASNRATLPDLASFDALTELDMAVLVAPDDWTGSGTQIFTSKFSGVDSSWRWGITSSGNVYLDTTVDGSTLVNGTSDSAALGGLLDAQKMWVRFTWRGSDGRVQHWYCDGSIADPQPSDWIKNGGDRSGAVGTMFNSTQSIMLGIQGTSFPMTGKFYRAIAKNTIDGGAATKLIDVNFVDAVEPYSTFNDRLGNVVTIDRAVSGKKAALVDRPMFLFGVDDYMELADHAALDFAAAESFALGFAVRDHNYTLDNKAYLTKKTSVNSVVGYALRHSGGISGALLIFADGVAFPNVAAPGVVGLATSFVGVRDVPNDFGNIYADGVIGGSVTDTTTGTLVSTSPVKIGNWDGNVSHGDYEFFGASVHRAALDAASVAALDSEFGTNV